MTEYTVTEIDLTPGERISVIRDPGTGLPLFDPMVWATTELRSAGQRPNSINQALRAIAVLQRYLDAQHISLDARLRAGKFLTQAEATGLAAACRIGLRRPPTTASDGKPPARVEDLEARRKRRATDAPQQVGAVKDSTASVRAHYIRQFLLWKLDDYLFKVGVDDQRFRDLQSLGKSSIAAFAEKVPKNRDYGAGGARQGLTDEARACLEAVTDPQSPRNPWTDNHTRVRNHLIVELFLALGIRAGELLGLRVRDISTATGHVEVIRRTNNPEDQRSRRGEVKTRERKLKLSPKLSELLRSYVLNERRALRAAKKHEFLFVASRTGDPLSYSALAKSFAQLRVAFPDALGDVVAHILRHTWNDAFSEQADQSGMSPDTEKKIRSYMMGWSEHSGMAATYTKRHTQREADAHLVAVQEKSATRRGTESGTREK
jgi:integrase